eukprot:jgi/Psemu1/36169/gm1.36169_g
MVGNNFCRDLVSKSKTGTKMCILPKENCRVSLQAIKPEITVVGATGGYRLELCAFIDEMPGKKTVLITNAIPAGMSKDENDVPPSEIDDSLQAIKPEITQTVLIVNTILGDLLPQPGEPSLTEFMGSPFTTQKTDQSEEAMDPTSLVATCKPQAWNQFWLNLEGNQICLKLALQLYHYTGGPKLPLVLIICSGVPQAYGRHLDTR